MKEFLNQEISKLQESEIVAHPQKKQKTQAENLFSDSEDEEETSDISKEINSYFEAKFSKSQDILKFWHMYSTIYPNISRLARKYLSVPATQFESERNFSMTGRTLE